MTSYAITSAAAGLYALGFIVLLAASVGDTRQQFNVQAWFSWQAVMLVVLVAERPLASRTARRWHAFLRQTLLFLAAAQAIGFIVWIAVEWSRAPSPPPGAPLNAAPDNVYAILIGALVANLVVAVGTFFAVLRNDVVWWW